MKMKITGLVITLLIILSVPVYGEEQAFIIGRVDAWPPFYYQENGEWHGSSVDAYRALADKAGIKLIFKNIPWSRALHDMEHKPIMLADLSPTEERARSMFFFGPHDNEIMGVLLSVKHKNEAIVSLNDLATLAKKNHKKIIYQQDYFFSTEFNARINSDPAFAVNFRKKTTLIKDSVRLVAENKYLGYMEDKRSLVYLIKSNNLSDKVFVHEYKLNETQVYMGVSKTISNDMYWKLKKADDILIKNNIYKKIQRKWVARQD